MPPVRLTSCLVPLCPRGRGGGGCRRSIRIITLKCCLEAFFSTGQQSRWRSDNIPKISMPQPASTRRPHFAFAEQTITIFLSSGEEGGGGFFFCFLMYISKCYVGAHADGGYVFFFRKCVKARYVVRAFGGEVGRRR